MTGQLRFLLVVCGLILIASIPWGLWCAATGQIIKAAILAVVALAAFIALIIVRRNLTFIRQMNQTFEDDNVTPL